MLLLVYSEHDNFSDVSSSTLGDNFRLRGLSTADVACRVVAHACALFYWYGE